MQEGMAFNAPMQAIETPPGQPGEIASDLSLLSLAPSNLVLSGVKRSEDGSELIVRFFETQGKTTGAMFAMPKPVQVAERVDLIESTVSGVSRPAVSGNRVSVSVKPYEIVSVKVRI